MSQVSLVQNWSSDNESRIPAINYLKAADLTIGFLVNFGNQKLEYKRLYHPDHFVLRARAPFLFPSTKDKNF